MKWIVLALFGAVVIYQMNEHYNRANCEGLGGKYIDRRCVKTVEQNK